MKKHNGFTIIEVALVLAIAGLIFLMVFIALPGLWRAERDGERRDDILTFVNTLKNFQSNNNRGALPTMMTGGNDSGDDQYRIKEKGDSGVDAAYVIGSSIKPSSDISGNTWLDFYKNYFNDSYADPLNDGGYNWLITTCVAGGLDKECENSSLKDTNPFFTNRLGLYNGSFDDNNYTVYIVQGATCDGATAVKSANSRKVAVLQKLEGADGVFCTNS